MGARAWPCLRRWAALAVVAALSVGVAGSAQALPPPGTQSVTVGCWNSVYGQLASDWRSPSTGAIVAGPIAFPYLRELAAHPSGPGVSTATSYAVRQGLAPALKTLVVVSAGTVVRLRIPTAERGRVSLDYTYVQTGWEINKQGIGPYFRVADGASQVTFRACSSGSGVERGGGGPTYFAGGFIVAGAQCARIEIYTSTSTQPLQRDIPFGVSQHSCPAIG